MPTPEDLSPSERLRIDNELKKAQLTDEHGAFFGDTSEEMSAEMEAEFLANIQALEAGGKDSYVAIRTLVSRKALKQTAAMAKRGKHQDAIDALTEALLEAGVFTEQPEWMHARGYYQFLSTDFLDHTIPEPPPVPPGSELRHMVGVMYDQVRSDSPNHMATVTENFLVDLLAPDEPFAGELLAHTCRDGAEVVDKATALAKIRKWKAQWREIKPVAFGPLSPMRGPDGAIYFEFGCEYHVTDHNGNTEEYNGPGLSQLALEDGEFRVVGFTMEGFEM